MNLISTALPAQIKSTIIITLVLSVIFIIVGLKIKKVKPEDKTPLWLVPFIIIVDLINNMTKENLGKLWKHYAPYFLTLAIYLTIANISGMFGLSSPTSYLLVNAALAFLSFLVIQLTGIISNGGKAYIKGFFEPIFILLPINLISEITLPVSLALRLMGNIMSGGVLSKMILGLGGWYVVPILPVYNLIFDIFFGVIQMVVFLLLTIMFAGMKLNDDYKLDEIKIENNN
jgi:F-type H+-transporting ATPase subunit a